MEKISVCVPSYNRPDMINQLIICFLNQDYNNKELIISDDSTNDEVKIVCESFNDENIKYYKNENNLGYAKNFLMSIKRANGDFILILGDDDLLLSSLTLSKYVEVFKNNPNVSYVYSNSIQFSNKLDIEYIFNTFKNDTYFKKGDESMKNIWTTSIFIPGMALRNNINFSLYYPLNDILFPQVELIGHVINMYDAFGLSDFLIAGRAHNEQLGFYAIKGERIKGGEQHGTIELFEIFRKLKNLYSLKINEFFLSESLIKSYSTMILKEKMIAGNKKIKFNYNNFCKISEVANKSKKLKFFYIIALASPRFLIKFTKYIFTKINCLKDKKHFIENKNKLNNILKRPI